MKNFLLSLFTLACVLTGYAMENSDNPQTLNDIINQESKNKTDVSYDQHMRRIWGKTTYLNISYNKTTLSSDELPLGGATVGSNEFKNKFGMGIQWGKTFNLHKQALGNAVFFGLDFTWLDLNFNQYDKADNITPGYGETTGLEIKSMPWHNKKTTVDYGLSVGPSFTLYPFTSLHSNATDNIRLHGYFHLGYQGEAFIIKEVGNESQYAWGHGLFTSFGASLTFNAIGLGVEMRNDNINVKHVDKDEFGAQKMKFKEKTTRVYLQFRF